MSITASFTPLRTQIETALDLDIAGNPPLFATIVSSAMASAVLNGKFPVGTGFIVPPPSGLSTTRQQIESALNLEIVGNPSLFAAKFATATIPLAPIVPPSGFDVLRQAVQTAFDLDIAGNVPTQGNIIATGIINYYLSGGVI